MREGKGRERVELGLGRSWASGVAHAEERKGKGRAGLGQGVWVASFLLLSLFFSILKHSKQNLFEFK
jgi:hypothetical protein